MVLYDLFKVVVDTIGGSARLSDLTSVGFVSADECLHLSDNAGVTLAKSSVIILSLKAWAGFIPF